MSKIIIPISKIVLGVCMVVLTLIAYIPIPADLVEMTFVSNFAGGAILILDGILTLKDKTIPTYLYENVSVCLFFVFLICAGSLTGAYKMNFKGAFFFLHTIFPILFILMYIIFVKDTNGKTLVKVLTTPVLMIAYLLFDFILGKISGEFVYGFFSANELSFPFALLVGLVFYLFLGLIGWAFIYFNSLVHRDKNKAKENNN
jgi:hypothetical protein